MMNLTKNWGVVLFFTIHLKYISSSVKLVVDQKEIVLGQRLKLSCESNDTIFTGSRRWFGGESDEILCLNGVSLNPAKYNEQYISDKKYLFNIEEVSVNDLICPYACLFGFQVDEIYGVVNESNFQHLPDESSTHVEYEENNGIYNLKVKFNKVFPTPTCAVITKVKHKKLTVTKRNRTSIFYNVQFSDQSKEPFHMCDSPVEIECFFANQTYLISHQHSLECIKYFPASNGSHMQLIAPLIILSIVILAVLISTIIFKRRYGRANQSTKSGTNKEICELSEPLRSVRKLSTISRTGELQEDHVFITKPVVNSAIAG